MVVDGHADAAAFDDEGDAGDFGGGVEAIARGIAGRLDQPFLLVESQGPQGDSETLGEFPDEMGAILDRRGVDEIDEHVGSNPFGRPIRYRLHDERLSEKFRRRAGSRHLLMHPQCANIENGCRS